MCIPSNRSNGKSSIKRRTFLKTSTALAATGALGFPNIVRAQADRKVRFALIGVNKRGAHHHRWASRQSVTALCDADTGMFHATTNPEKNREGSQPAKRFSSAKQFQDYRELMQHPDLFDAVVISTPDHTHFAAAQAALKLGKGVFCEKPLTWSVAESLELMHLTEQNQLPTQMGNQGMGDPGWRKAYSYYHAGLIGQVHTVHAWHPKKKPEHTYHGTAGLPRPTGEDPVPKSLDWDVWIGPAPMRPYVKNRYHPAKWRQTVDFGNGTLGDWCCHKLNAVFMTLNPGMPTKVWNQDVTGWNQESWPTGRRVHWEFAAGEVTRYGQADAKPRDGFKMVWHEGDAQPTHADLPDWPANKPVPIGGVMMIGEKGSIHVEGSHNGNASLLPWGLHEQHGKLPIAEEVPGRDHFYEFVDSCQGKLAWNAPLSNFMHGGHMTAVSMLGNVSLRMGQELLLDSTGTITNVPNHNAAISRVDRPGWS